MIQSNGLAGRLGAGLFAIGFFAGMIVSSAQAVETVKIASIFSYSGTTARMNAASVQGVRNGVKEINERSGIPGMKFELVELDDRNTPIGSKVAADRAVKENVVAIIGPAWSSHAIAVATVAQQNRIPMITTTATSDKVTLIGDCIFRVCYTDSFQGLVMAQFARDDLNAETAVVCVNVQSDYSMGLAQSFGQDFERMGGRVLGEVQYVYHQRDFEPLVMEIQKKDPDVVYIPGHDESGTIIKHMMQAGVRAIPLGGDGWITEPFYTMGGNRLKQGYCSSHWAEDIPNEASKRYVMKYGSGRKLVPSEVLGYDAVMLLADAIERAGSVSREEIRDSIARTKGFKGVTGIITFDSYGNPRKSAVIFKIEEGQIHFFKSIVPK